MKREFGLPIAFAAALHGAVLFGFPKTPRTAPPPEDVTIIYPFTVAPVDPEPPVELAEPVPHARQRTEPDLRAPVVSPEPPAIMSDPVFTIAPPLVTAEGIDLGKVFEIPTHPAGPGGTGTGDIVTPGLLDNPPRARLQAAPIYPYEAKRDGMRGEVLVEFMVDETGSVVAPRVVHATHRVFEEASIRAVAKWRFEPGRRDGRIVRFRMSVPVVFNLNE